MSGFLKDLFLDMLENYNMSISDKIFYVLMGLGLILIFILNKDDRKKIVFPLAFLFILAANPVTYFIYSRLVPYSYWRLCWLFPVIPVIAMLFPSIVDKIEKKWVKIIVAAALVLSIVLGGHFIYGNTVNAYSDDRNMYKIPDACVHIGEYVLSENANPKIVVPEELICYMRQYDGNINMLYGRDVQDFIMQLDYYSDQKRVFFQTKDEEPNFYLINVIMKKNNCDFFVFQDTFYDENGNVIENTLEEKILKHGFEKANSIDGYGIYRVCYETESDNIYINDGSYGKIINHNYFDYWYMNEMQSNE